MKRWLILVLGLCLYTTASGQIGRFFEKKDNIRDFQSRTTKIVLTQPDSMMDLLLRDAIEADWYLSPFEFCSWEDFQRLKSDSTYYFLLRANGQHSKENEPAMEFLTLVKGGSAAEKGLDAMPEILTLPLQPIQESEGRIFSFLPAYVRIIQAHVLKVIRENRNHFSGVSDYAEGIDGNKTLNLLFEQDDFAYEVADSTLQAQFKGKARMATVEEIDAALTAGTPNTCVSLVLAPTINQRGSYCYKMIIRADTYELLFFRKHKINARNGAGFLQEDIRRLAVPYAH